MRENEKARIALDFLRKLCESGDHRMIFPSGHSRICCCGSFGTDMASSTSRHLPKTP